MISSSLLETDVLFSAVLAPAFAGIAFHALGWLEQRLVFWQRAEAD